MNKNFEQYLKRAKEVGMTSEEREKIFSNLKAVVLSTPEGSPSFLQFHLSGYSFQFSRQAVSVFAVLAVIVLTTGTSFAAGGALPGDLLYPVKINLNEKVQGYIAESQGTKEDFEVKVALTRLEEAEQLESEGRLDEASKKTIETNFQEHAANINSDKTYDASQVRMGKARARFQAALEDHRGALKLWSDVSKDSNKPNLNSLIQTVDDQLKMREKATSTIDVSEKSVIQTNTSPSHNNDSNSYFQTDDH